MAASDPVTGKLGRIKGTDGAGASTLSTIRNWAIEQDVPMSQVIASNTSCGEDNVEGVRSWSGSFEGYGEVPRWMPGDDTTIDFVGFVGANDGIVGNVGTSYAGKIVIQSVTINIDLSTNEPINYTADFVGHLELVVATDEVFFEDASQPSILPPCASLGVEMSDGLANPAVGFDAMDHFVTAALTMEVGVAPYVDTQTVVTDPRTEVPTGRKICWTGNRIDAPKRWELAITRNSRNYNEYPPGLERELRLYTDATRFFLFRWAIAGTPSGITVDLQGGGVVAFTQTWNMRVSNAGDGFTSGTPARDGLVLLPDGSTWYTNTPA